MKFIIIDESTCWQKWTANDLLSIYDGEHQIWGIDELRTLLFHLNDYLTDAYCIICESQVRLTHPDINTDWYKDLCNKFSWLINEKENILARLIQNEILRRQTPVLIYTCDNRPLEWAQKMEVPVIEKTSGDNRELLRTGIAKAIQARAILRNKH